ncbi:DNA methyltransferase [Euzebyella marina]|nr:site-specific DNA-methyltransferase [Euzebyella marina]
MNLSEKEREYLIDKLGKGESIPIDFKYKLFPSVQKEYELAYAGKMRKEDILSDEDGVTAVPLQVEKVFNGNRDAFPDGWKNMIVFGDNLQLLKTIYKNEDPLIKGKVKGKVKLIYIDPPFATESDFNGTQGQKAYSDKTKNSEFVEFLRRRLIVAKEVLASDGVIFVHLDWKKVHYIKVLMDEIFGEHNFKNSITWHYGGRMMHHLKQFNRKHEIILFYTQTQSGYTFKMPKDEVDFDEYAKSRHEKIHVDKNGKRYLLAPDANMERTTRQYEDEIVARGRAVDDVWPIRYIRGNAKERTGYPTQKPEELIKRIIESTTNEGDLVMDFFGGSGTTASVAEKLNRKWLVCDIGKFSFYTMQKRLLTIQNSKSLIEKKKNYKIPAKSFCTINTGIYDIQKLFQLQHEEYIEFVLNLFEVYPKIKSINGVEFQGERKDGYLVQVWKYWDFKDASIDEYFLRNLHENIGNRVGDRLYLIAPANSVEFIDDYFEIGKVRYYFLKVPYQIIEELHKKRFKKFRQPTSSSDINNLDNAIGFHFIRQPEVKSNFDGKNLNITSFKTYYPDEETLNEIPDFEALAMVLVDNNYNGKEFILSESFFAEDIFKKGEPINISLKAKNGKKVCVIYVDIFGNEFREILNK